MTSTADPTTIARPAFPNAHRRAQCPHCGRSISLTVDADADGAGPLRAHRFLAEPCPGSGLVVTATRRTEVAR